MRTPVRVLQLMLAAALGGCSDTTGQVNVTPVPRDGATYVPSTEWRTAQLEQVGIDAKPIESLTQRMQSGAIPGLNALLIVREGYLVLEEYFNGSSRDDVHTMQSVTKSVTSLVTGVAVDQGR